MKSIEDLPGTIVLVKPDHRVGIITEIPPEPNSVIVTFYQNEPVLFPTNALFIMRNPEDIKRDALNDFTLMPREDYYDIMEILMFIDSTRPEERQVAVELASKNPMAMEYAMQPLNEALGLRHNYNYGR